MNIKVTVEVDGSEVTRNYNLESAEHHAWTPTIVDMVETVVKSKEAKF